MISMNELIPALSLRERMMEYRAGQPQARMRDVAIALGVSEGALVAACCGAEVVRLEPRWKDFLNEMPSLGEVMVLTRNEAIVHEKDGTFGHVGFIGQMAQVVNHDVDLRIFLRNWKHLFAFQQESHGRTLLSFQVFDGRGQAIHKIFLRPQSNAEEYRRIVAALSSADQQPDFTVEAASAPLAAARPAADVAVLRERWAAMKDTHEFFPMIRDLGLTRRGANALVGPDFARRLPASAFEATLRAAAAQAVPIMVFVGNPGCIQIHTGLVHRIERMGEWLNVLDPGFNLHARADLIAEAWLVRKPTVDGIVTSIEIFDAAGDELALLFGERKPGKPELETWRALTAQIAATI
ncbi:MAG TPA: ChuX/HutX family heme-like substrate-binding protein [Kiritimatiellia bacterium]|nr:ChuX/HutX family heme-like substrate-binding protein [Kiritimatiellia bacterium]